MSVNTKTICLSCGFLISDISDLLIRKKTCRHCKNKQKKISLYYVCPRCGNNLNFPRPQVEIIKQYK